MPQKKIDGGTYDLILTKKELSEWANNLKDGEYVKIVWDLDYGWFDVFHVHNEEEN